jgi:uncharacterized C2H2 Zn-finger protein
MKDEKRWVSSTLRQLAIELNAAKKRAKELGLFAEDRELLSCPSCGLVEDVDARGLLSTYVRPVGWDDPDFLFDAKLPPDTGLRSDQLGEGTFSCPACGGVVQEESDEL